MSLHFQRESEYKKVVQCEGGTGSVGKAKAKKESQMFLEKYKET